VPDFHGKEEFKFVEPAAGSFAILDEHPLLIDYQFVWESIYIAAPVTAFDNVLSRLIQAIQLRVDGWRLGSDYLNRFGAERILREGFGQVLAAPYPVAETCRAVLRDAHARFSSLPTQPARWPRQVLVVGRNYVVAQSFRLEELTRPD
jgi:hypothetical protein